MFLRNKPVRDHSEELYIVKHAPKQLLDFKGNTGVVQTLSSYIECGNIPNLIITGPHGTGKSLLTKLLVTEYMESIGAGSKSNWINKGVLEIYGSLSRGKDVVSEKQSVKNKQKNFNCANITDFMKRATSLPKGILKIVIIYEFHQMSNEAQMALRRIMELNAHKVRFIFVTEDYGQIILALQSRCTILKLNRLQNVEIGEIVDEISKAENINVTSELKELLYLNSDGDIRVAVNLLQMLGKCESDPDTGKVNSAKYYEILGIPEIETIKEILKACRNGDGQRAHIKVKQLMESGYDISDLLDILTKVLITTPNFNGKNIFLRVLAKDTYTIQECYTETQLHNLINHLAVCT
tara:strand:- start:9675 stop:10730 length:1056 start_codon:yes stop_codon:yes gene_type:complete